MGFDFKYFLEALGSFSTYGALIYAVFRAEAWIKNRKAQLSEEVLIAVEKTKVIYDELLDPSLSLEESLPVYGLLEGGKYEDLSKLQELTIRAQRYFRKGEIAYLEKWQEIWPRIKRLYDCEDKEVLALIEDYKKIYPKIRAIFG